MRIVARIIIVLGLLALAGCGLPEGDGRHMVPLSSGVKTKLTSMGSSPGEPMVVRIFKKESQLEVWKRTKSGTYALFKSYEICAWSGDIGPKIKEGDRQSPEGFYTITPGLMNPKSSYYLAFNTGFPNKFDRAWGRTGSELMVHGDCSSRGCYAMTDESIAEIYALGRESFAGGQRDFQLQIFPFRMTPKNMALYADSPHLAFWQNIKEGYDYFELTKQPPDWDVCGKQYVFNAKGPGGAPLDASAACPALTRDAALYAQVQARQAADRTVFEAELADQAAIKAKRAEAEAQAAAEKQALAARTEAVNNTVNGFFSGLFGGGNKPAKATVPTGPAPVPAPRTNKQS